MRHFLAKILNCAAPLLAALPAIFLVPGLSDFAAINSSGRESPHVPGDSIPAQRTDIFPPGAESDRASSIAPDVMVDRALSFGAEAVEGAPSSPGSTVASSDPEQPNGAGEPPPQECVSTELTPNSSLEQSGNPACGGTRSTLAEIAEARAYLLETASPGYTMTLQGPEVAISRLHPEFAVRLESAIREARNAGLPFAGIFSAYRPPVFGVGGFSDKFHSLHTYGLAVDMRGIGRPGSPEAQLWHQIAAKNGVVCPYGPRDRAEWNHCQPTSIKIILADNPLRQTVNSEGPSDLEAMFEVGSSIIEEVASAAEALSKAAPTAGTCAGNLHHRSRTDAASDGRPRHATPHHGAARFKAQRRQTSAAPKGRCRHRRRWADHRSREGSARVVRPASETRRPCRRTVKNCSSRQ